MSWSKNKGNKHESCNESRNRKRDVHIRAKFNRDDFCDAVRGCRRREESSSCEKKRHHKRREESSSCESRRHHKRREESSSCESRRHHKRRRKHCGCFFGSGLGF